MATIPLTEKEIDLILLLRQVEAENVNRDFDLMLCYRGNHLQVRRVQMPERLRGIATKPKPMLK